MWQLWKTALTYVNHFGPQEWLLALLGVVLVGVFCMRGFGSRSSY